ncbi:hypothetical protein I4Z71_002949 [Salmonella enterica subsp. enterica serovar Grumpensis]|nr:hypothetical protein [Salmonella enterica subsp. enterica serovar Grumpensis]
MFALLLNGKQLDPATFINVGYITLRPCYTNFAPITVIHAQAYVAYESVLPLMVGRIWMSYLVQH